jgi:hypothetical protein
MVTVVDVALCTEHDECNPAMHEPLLNRTSWRAEERQ